VGEVEILESRVTAQSAQEVMEGEMRKVAVRFFEEEDRL
jgi:hypothetical protein